MYIIYCVLLFVKILNLAWLARGAASDIILNWIYLKKVLAIRTRDVHELCSHLIINYYLNLASASRRFWAFTSFQIMHIYMLQ